jgi:hypothetical protein
MVEFNLKTVTLIDLENWQDVQIWCLDHLASYVESNMEVITEEVTTTSQQTRTQRFRCYHFSFADDADAMWFGLKWSDGKT